MSWIIWGYHGLHTTRIQDFVTAPPWALVHRDPPPPVVADPVAFAKFSAFHPQQRYAGFMNVYWFMLGRKCIGHPPNK